MSVMDIPPPGYTSELNSPISDTPPLSSSLSNIPILPPVPERVPFGNPPSYGIASRPVEPLVYSFSTVGPTSMLLLPPPSAPDTRPRYHISVSTNCFTPSSYITIVRKGASENGELIGEFEMGLTSKLKPPTVYVRGQEALLGNTLDDSRRHVTDRLVTFWDDGSTTKCYRTEHCRPLEILAEFIVPGGLRRLGEPALSTKLKIYPEGQEHFDDILISILVLERKRTTLAVKEEVIVASSSIRKPMRSVHTSSPLRDTAAVTDVGGPSRQRRWHYTEVPPSAEGGDYNSQLHSL
ncbi:uncharacterized protein EV420DRAFT_1642555 [Desarmillaria tabescens]|uniref:Uncharacterized protein n=1 Tax=Armillaria tabescens TaxID=1929756 RepID=A0AA39KF62_ARMTA|nr:uncharacterized protein EV420DRAFT_1642555 [Desarmillaria tabescens]KAK0458835.1 hypothetical protein EV420DRAFT_1642555 [Desarmillaria tabescens]